MEDILSLLIGLMYIYLAFVGMQLGERSKLLLKDLLDGATERVLETHKKVYRPCQRVDFCQTIWCSFSHHFLQSLLTK